MSKIDSEVDLPARLSVISGLPIRLDDKIFMSLVCLGLIPAWEVDFLKSESEVNDLNAKLIDAGFETRTREMDKSQKGGPDKQWEICYSNLIELVDRLFKLKENPLSASLAQDLSVEAEYGELYGFPPTAVAAYVNDKQNTFSKRNLPSDGQDRDYIFLVQFALSNDHWQEELEVARKWANALMQNVPDLWQEFVAEHKKLKAANYGDWPG